MPNWIGRRLGNYKLDELLGRGGCAEVYRGMNVELGTLAAIKVLTARLTEEGIERFRTEARIIANFRHNHIVQMHDFGIEKGTPYLIMEYAQKGSLAGLRTRDQALPYITIVSYIKQVAAALHYAHNEGVIHCDVKPANILIRRNDEVVLSDFGIALIVRNSQPPNLQDVVGTPKYMAPEQIQGRPSPASDQYALGVIAYEWLSGTARFQGTTEEILQWHISAQPAPLSLRILESVNKVVLRALSKTPEERFASVQEFADALEHAYLDAAQAAQRPPQHIPPELSTLPNTAVYPTAQCVPDSGPLPASSTALIARYDEVIQKYLQLKQQSAREYTTIQQHLAQDLEAIEQAGKQAHERISAQIHQVRDDVRSAQNVLQSSSSRWKYLTEKRRPTQLLPMPRNEQEARTLLAGVSEERSTITSAVKNYDGRSTVYPRALFGIFGFAIVLALLYGFYYIITLAWHGLSGATLPLFGSAVSTFFIWIFIGFTSVALLWLSDHVQTTRAIRKQYTLLMNTSSTLETIDTQRDKALAEALQRQKNQCQARYLKFRLK